MYRKRTYRRRSRSRTVPGSTRSVRRGVSRDIPIYSSRVSSRALTHMVPIISGSNTIYANGDVPSNGTYPNMKLLNIVARGTGLELRDNNKMFMRDLFLSGHMYGNTDPAIYSTLLRLAIVYDRDPHGVTANVQDIFDSGTADFFPKVANRERFDILYMKNYMLRKDPVWNTSTLQAQYFYGPGSSVIFRLKIPVRRFTTWSPTNTDGTIGSMDKGALFIVLSSGAVSGATNSYCTFSHRLTFDPVM